MKFDKKVLQDLVCERVYESEDGSLKLQIVQCKHNGDSRWSQHYRAVFTDGTKFYETGYSRGSTEYQDESPYEYDKDEIECPQVVPIPETVTKYITLEELEKKQAAEQLAEKQDGALDTLFTQDPLFPMLTVEDEDA